MALDLDPTERRIVGSLIEKELSVPETYPLTLNALVAACNQKNNRDPETSLPEYMVSGALRALLSKGWVMQVERDGSRTPRFSHQARQQLGVEEADLAILAELFLRGPQSSPELKTRAARMRPQGSVEQVEARLVALSQRPVPYVKNVGKRPGERVARWQDLIGTHAETTSGGAPAPASEAPRATTPTPAAPAAAARLPAPADPLASILERLERMEREVERLRAAIEPLIG